MSLLRRPPTKIQLTADEVRTCLEQAAQEEQQRRNNENLRRAKLEELNRHKADMQVTGEGEQSGKKSTRARTRDERIGIGSSRAAGSSGTGSGRMTEHTRNAR